MANLIDTSYFEGEIEVPNSNQAEIAADLNDSITKYEQEVLIYLLGYALFKELKAQPNYTSGDKWDKLVNGEEFTYTVNGATVTTRWEGLKGFSKKSLIAYYVYWMHRRKRKSYTAGGGAEAESKSANSDKVSPYIKMVEVWNEFIKMYGITDCYYDLGEVVAYSYLTYPVDQYPSALNYLIAKRADFTNWVFTGKGGMINIFGI
jgi:hypothetical protein